MVSFPVICPHGEQIFRADHQSLKIVIVLENTRERRRHHGLAEADHVADQYPAALIDVMCGDFDRCFLKGEQPVLQLVRQVEFGYALAGLAG